MSHISVQIWLRLLICNIKILNTASTVLRNQ